MSSPTTTLNDQARGAVIALDRMIYYLARHWVLIIAIVVGVYIGLPLLAPIFMQLGWKNAANVIYIVYSTQCHQLPERSFFLFGSKPMYSLAEIQTVWRNTNNPLILRQFIGNPEMGWKMAWSDRMVSMYGGLWLFTVLWPLLRRVKPLPWWGMALLALPMALDGGTHFISDLAGIGQGFRDSNAWLAALTGNTLPASFYAGDALGSFNSWMRILTGVLFGLGLVWFAFPYLQARFDEIKSVLEARFERAGRAL